MITLLHKLSILIKTDLISSINNLGHVMSCKLEVDFNDGIEFAIAKILYYSDDDFFELLSGDVLAKLENYIENNPTILRLALENIFLQVAYFEFGFKFYYLKIA